MSETVIIAIQILGQGMAGIFVAMLVIMLATTLLNKIKTKAKN